MVSSAGSWLKEVVVQAGGHDSVVCVTPLKVEWIRLLGIGGEVRARVSLELHLNLLEGRDPVCAIGALDLAGLLMRATPGDVDSSNIAF